MLRDCYFIEAETKESHARSQQYISDQLDIRCVYVSVFIYNIPLSSKKTGYHR